MKRILPLLIGLIVLVAMPMMALAEEVVGLPDGFFTWDFLGTFAGAVAAVVYIVQLLKLPINRIWKIPTDIVVYFVSLVVLLLAQAFVPSLGGLTLQSGLLCALCAVLVALSAMSTYRLTIQKVEEKRMVNDSIEPAELLTSDLIDMDDLAAKLVEKIKENTSATGA